MFFERFGAERHADRVQAPYQVVWSGTLEIPLTDRYRFHALLGKNERISVAVNGQLVYAAGHVKGVDEAVDLSAGERVPIRIKYENPDGRAELKLFWRSRVLDPEVMPVDLLYAEE